VGATDAQVAAVDRGDFEDGSLDEAERAALRFTTEVVRDVRASDEALAALTAAGLSPREVVELLLVIGQYMLVARLAETAGIEVDEPADVLDSSRRGGRR
jgi:alkylhydroperoxidase family enzyme